MNLTFRGILRGLNGNMDLVALPLASSVCTAGDAIGDDSYVACESVVLEDPKGVNCCS